MKMNECSLNRVVKQNVRKMLNEVASKQTLIRQFYRLVTPLTHNRFHDEAWENVHHIFDVIGDWCNQDMEVTVKDGGYRKSRDGMNVWKEYNFTLQKDGFTLSGVLNANACGTVEDIWKYYDVTINVW